MKIIYRPSEGKEITHNCDKELQTHNDGYTPKRAGLEKDCIIECSCGQLYTIIDAGLTYSWGIRKSNWRERRAIKKIVNP